MTNTRPVGGCWSVGSSASARDNKPARGGIRRRGRALHHTSTVVNFYAASKRSLSSHNGFADDRIDRVGVRPSTLLRDCSRNASRAKTGHSRSRQHFDETMRDVESSRVDSISCAAQTPPSSPQGSKLQGCARQHLICCRPSQGHAQPPRGQLSAADAHPS